MVVVWTTVSGLTMVAGRARADAESAALLGLLAESRDDDS
jgi:hypothetical protein